MFFFYVKNQTIIKLLVLFCNYFKMTDWISYTDIIIQNLDDTTISQDDINYADKLIQHILSNSESIVYKFNFFV